MCVKIVIRLPSAVLLILLTVSLELLMFLSTDSICITFDLLKFPSGEDALPIILSAFFSLHL